jgi:formylglycine-generating enzyme required for sulfatase activity/energy-coupling factor transporter ATP-binding protein EcfA2
MRLTRSQLYLFLALLTVAIGVVTNVATGQMPAWLQPYLWLSWPILVVLAVIFIILSVVQVRQESAQPPHPSEPEPERPERPEEPQPEPPSWKRISDRQALRRYLEQVIEEHKYFTFLGRAKPLDLERIYIALRVGEYVPRQYQPDASGQAVDEPLPEQRSGTVEVPEALRLHHRLVVLGEPGSGKTTLLKYLALRIARRDPALSEFARERVPRSLPRLADRMHRRLAAASVALISLVLGLVALGFWVWGVFHSPSPLLAALAGLGLTFMLLLILIRFSRRSILVCTALSIGLLVYCALAGVVPLLAVGAMGLTLVVLLYPYWIQPPLAALNGLRERTTHYPLPLYLTLNDLAHSDKPLETHLAEALQEARFAHPERFLQWKLERGECLVLLDALDEVVDEAAYRRVVTEINRFAVTWHRNQMMVTCRIAGFRGLLQGFLQLEVQEFNAQQVALFTRNWFADSPPEEQQSRVDGLLRCLGRSPRLRLLAANPLLLSIVALLYQRKFTLPERRVELYEECAQVLLQKREIEKGLDTQTRFPPEKKRSALQSVAAHFHQQGVRIFTEEELLAALAAVLPGLGVPDTQNSEFLREIMERSGLLRQKSRTSYDFTHLTFQEFFAAAAFHEQGDTESLLSHLDDPWWREVILLGVALEDDATPFLERLREHDLLLAAAALADARPVQTDAFERVAGQIITELKRLVEEDAPRRQAAADALAEIARWGATEYLVEKARDEGDTPVALAAVLGLARAAERTVLDDLLAQQGPILRLLHGSLGRAQAEVRGEVEGRILSLLETLSCPMVLVPAGEFLMGSNEFSDERPPHQVHLDDYWIGKYPVTNAQFQRFVSETGHTPGDWRGEFTPGKENHPVVNVSWHDAVAFCEWAGTSLPTEAQWEMAARGTDGRTYPWGNQWDGNRCNVSGRGTTPVDRYPNGVSPYGCYDMAGNVYEWCRSLYKPYPYDPTDGREDLTAVGDRVLRGGAFSGNGDDARAAYRGHSHPDNRFIYDGFRVGVAAPSSPVLDAGS